MKNKHINLRIALIAGILLIFCSGLPAFGKSNRMVRITVMNLECTMSDDEGPNNPADIDRLSISSAGKNIYSYSISGSKEIWKGNQWPVYKYVYLVVPETGKISLSGSGRDYDSCFACKSDEGSGSSRSIPMQEIIRRGGHYSGYFDISSTDFAFKVFFVADIVENDLTGYWATFYRGKKTNTLVVKQNGSTLEFKGGSQPGFAGSIESNKVTINKGLSVGILSNNRNSIEWNKNAKWDRVKETPEQMDSTMGTIDCNGGSARGCIPYSYLRSGTFIRP